MQGYNLTYPLLLEVMSSQPNSHRIKFSKFDMYALTVHKTL